MTTAKRWSELPDVPTLAEAGVPGYEATLWLSISGPAGMPADIVQRLNAEIAKALRDPELQNELPRRRRRRHVDGPAGAERLHARRVREVGPRGARNRRDRQLSVSCSFASPPWPGQAGPAPKPRPACRRFAELEAAGARIGEIRVVTQDIFDLSDPRENNWLYRLANKLHITTRPDVIRQLLLFETGEPVSVQRIEETERLLRSRHYLYEARIEPIAYRDGVVDIEVNTRDTWSLDLGIGVSRAGGHNTGRLSIKEENILGSGILVGIGYTSDVDRKGTTFQVADSNLFGTRGTIAYSYADNDDGNGAVVFAAASVLCARCALGRGVQRLRGRGHRRRLYNAGEVVAEYRQRSRGADVFGGWSQGLIGRWVRRYSVGLSHQDNDYELKPGSRAARAAAVRPHAHRAVRALPAASKTLSARTRT